MNYLPGHPGMLDGPFRPVLDAGKASCHCVAFSSDLVLPVLALAAFLEVALLAAFRTSLLPDVSTWRFSVFYFLTYLLVPVSKFAFWHLLALFPLYHLVL